MTKIRLWFNHWFSTAYWIIDLLDKDAKKDGISIEFIGTNKIPYTVYRDKCNEFYLEPTDISGDDYVDWCLNFCREHAIDVFFPRREFTAVSRRKADFDALGIKVLVDSNHELLALLGNKKQTADLIGEIGSICKVPPIEIINNVSELKAAYDKIHEAMPDTRVCIKYSEGEGATSFRVIDENMADIKSLDTGTGLKTTYAQLEALLGTTATFADLMIMPYLDGIEISIDCLNTRDGFIAIPRFKVGGRVTQVSTDPYMIEAARVFAEHTGLQCPFNLQLRYHRDELYILEVNTRMSGGVQLSCLAGVNIPYLALRQLLGLDVTVPKDLKEVKVSYIETPVIMNLDVPFTEGMITSPYIPE